MSEQSPFCEQLHIAVQHQYIYFAPSESGSDVTVFEQVKNQVFLFGFILSVLGFEPTMFVFFSVFFNRQRSGLTGHHTPLHVFGLFLFLFSCVFFWGCHSVPARFLDSLGTSSGWSSLAPCKALFLGRNAAWVFVVDYPLLFFVSPFCVISRFRGKCFPFSDFCFWLFFSTSCAKFAEGLVSPNNFREGTFGFRCLRLIVDLKIARKEKQSSRNCA